MYPTTHAAAAGGHVGPHEHAPLLWMGRRVRKDRVRRHGDQVGISAKAHPPQEIHAPISHDRATVVPFAPTRRPWAGPCPPPDTGGRADSSSRGRQSWCPGTHGCPGATRHAGARVVPRRTADRGNVRQPTPSRRSHVPSVLEAYPREGGDGVGRRGGRNWQRGRIDGRVFGYDGAVAQQRIAYADTAQEPANHPASLVVALEIICPYSTCILKCCTQTNTAPWRPPTPCTRACFATTVGTS